MLHYLHTRSIEQILNTQHSLITFFFKTRTKCDRKKKEFLSPMGSHNRI